MRIFKRNKNEQEKIAELLDVPVAEVEEHDRLVSEMSMKGYPGKPLAKLDHRERLRKYPPVPVALFEAQQGYAKLRKVHEYNNEMIEDMTKKKETTYTGWNPFILEIDRSIFPRRIQRWFSPNIRVRSYYKVKGEPCTRNPSNGSILDQEKKRNSLIEKGVIDEEGFLLDEKGVRREVDDHWVKVDFSDVDYVKNEWHSFFQSKSIDHSNKSMARTGLALDDVYKWIALGGFAAIVIVVFIMAGGI